MAQVTNSVLHWYSEEIHEILMSYPVNKVHRKLGKLQNKVLMDYSAKKKFMRVYNIYSLVHKKEYICLQLLSQ